MSGQRFQTKIARELRKRLKKATKPIERARLLHRMGRTEEAKGIVTQLASPARRAIALAQALEARPK